MSKKEEIDSLKEGEVHPATHLALEFIKKYLSDYNRYPNITASLGSLSLSGSREAKIYDGTIERILLNKPVGERYILGLYFLLNQIEHINKENSKGRKI